MYPKLDYDPVRSFAPVAWVARVPNVLLVNASMPAKNLGPAEIVSALNRQINQSLGSETVKARLASEGAEPTPATPQAFGQLIASEMSRWERVIKSAHITID